MRAYGHSRSFSLLTAGAGRFAHTVACCSGRHLSCRGIEFPLLLGCLFCFYLKVKSSRGFSRGRTVCTPTLWTLLSRYRRHMIPRSLLSRLAYATLRSRTASGVHTMFSVELGLAWNEKPVHDCSAVTKWTRLHVFVLYGLLLPPPPPCIYYTQLVQQHSPR